MKTPLLLDSGGMSTKLSFDISVQDGDQNSVLSPSAAEDDDDNHYDNFVEEFMDKVSIKTIMGGSRSIGRQEARIMLALNKLVTMIQVSSC